jgi:phenylpyruvate tautomerase PptA (4-oxalocrotonate tautomerase family)
MPLVRIAIMKGKPQDYATRVGDIVHGAMVEAINVPEKDRFQIVTEHDADSLRYDPSYLDIQRTEGIIVIQITLNEGRSLDLKKAFYRTVAERLQKEMGIRMEDVMINLVEVKKENWSFGNGVAQYAP